MYLCINIIKHFDFTKNILCIIKTLFQVEFPQTFDFGRFAFRSTYNWSYKSTNLVFPLSYLSFSHSLSISLSRAQTYTFSLSVLNSYFLFFSYYLTFFLFLSIYLSLSLSLSSSYSLSLLLSFSLSLSLFLSIYLTLFLTISYPHSLNMNFNKELKNSC